MFLANLPEILFVILLKTFEILFLQLMMHRPGFPRLETGLKCEFPPNSFFFAGNAASLAALPGEVRSK